LTSEGLTPAASIRTTTSSALRDSRRRSIAGAIDAAFGALACRRTQVASQANAEAGFGAMEVVADMLPP
jgi:hypothetical protein